MRICTFFHVLRILPFKKGEKSPKRLEKVGDNLRRLEKSEKFTESWRSLEKIGNNWRWLEIV